jgi:hypothetical protein
LLQLANPPQIIGGAATAAFVNSIPENQENLHHVIAETSREDVAGWFYQGVR